MARLVPIGDNIFLRKCTTGKYLDGSDGLPACGIVDGVAIPDWKSRNSDAYEILDIGPDCKLFKREHIGYFVHIPIWHRLIKPVIQKRLFMVPERIFQPYKLGGVTQPAPAPAFVVYP